MGEVHPHSKKGMAYIVVATEYLTKWAKAKAVKNDTAASAATFMYENIIYRFGCPKILVSDRGTHFFNSLIQEIMDSFHIDHSKTNLYHLQTNSQTERINDTLMNILCKIITDSERDWDGWVLNEFGWICKGYPKPINVFIWLWLVRPWLQKFVVFFSLWLAHSKFH